MCGRLRRQLVYLCAFGLSGIGEEGDDTVDDDFPALNDAHQMKEGNQGEDENRNGAKSFHGKA